LTTCQETAPCQECCAGQRAQPKAPPGLARSGRWRRRSRPAAAPPPPYLSAQAGTITCPPRERLFYLSQRPYLVTGTLRDQIVYPSPPRAVLASASPAERARFAAISGGRDELPDDIDEQLARILGKVELEYLLTRGSGWDQVRAGACCCCGGAASAPARRLPFIGRLVLGAPAVCEPAAGAVGRWLRWGAPCTAEAGLAAEQLRQAEAAAVAQ
jgi:hypothetical protein